MLFYSKKELIVLSFLNNFYVVYIFFVRWFICRQADDHSIINLLLEAICNLQISQRSDRIPQNKNNNTICKSDMKQSHESNEDTSNFFGHILDMNQFGILFFYHQKFLCGAISALGMIFNKLRISNCGH